MLASLLKERFGYTSFRPGQQEVVEDVVQGHNVFAMLPTGSGKSLCYLLAGYELKGLVLIISPLLSLMEDQVQNIRLHGEKRVAALNSFLSMDQKQQVLQELEGIRFLFLSPEMLQSKRLQYKLRQRGVVLFTVDEAHCVSQWGYDFRPDYLKLKDIRQNLGNPPCLALTATADPEVREDIKEKLGISHCKEHVYSVDRPNIALKVEELAGQLQKQQRMVELVRELKGPGIVYFSSREQAEIACQHLQEKTGLRVNVYHGGVSNDERRLIQNQYLNDELDVVCCTNAFGMGINKHNVRYVIHFHYPKHINAYLQEIGRAGRDGKPSVAILLFSEDDHDLPKFLIEKEYPNPHQLSAILQESRSKDVNEIERLAMDKGCSETAARFITDQVSGFPHSMSLDELNQEMTKRIFERKRVKLLELQKLTDWLMSKGCRRQSLLRLFGENFAHQTAHPCCDACGLSLTPYSDKEFHEQASLKEPAKLSWGERLELLLSRDELNG